MVLSKRQKRMIENRDQRNLRESWEGDGAYQDTPKPTVQVNDGRLSFGLIMIAGIAAFAFGAVLALMI